jgi:hypothetical protein
MHSDRQNILSHSEYYMIDPGAYKNEQHSICGIFIIIFLSWWIPVRTEACLKIRRLMPQFNPRKLYYSTAGIERIVVCLFRSDLQSPEKPNAYGLKKCSWHHAIPRYRLHCLFNLLGNRFDAHLNAQCHYKLEEHVVAQHQANNQHFKETKDEKHQCKLQKLCCNWICSANLTIEM